MQNIRPKWARLKLSEHSQLGINAEEMPDHDSDTAVGVNYYRTYCMSTYYKSRGISFVNGIFGAYFEQSYISNSLPAFIHLLFYQ